MSALVSREESMIPVQTIRDDPNHATLLGADPDNDNGAGDDNRNGAGNNDESAAGGGGAAMMNVYAGGDDEEDVCGVCLEPPALGAYVELWCCGNTLCVTDAQQLGRCPFCREEPLIWNIIR